MSISQSDLDSFHQFASHALAHYSEDLSLGDLVKQWHAERDKTIESIRRGVNDPEAGRTRDLADIDAAIRAELDFPARRR